MKIKTKTKTKTKTKAKITKRKKKQQKYLGEKIYFEVILMIILIPTIVLFLVPIFQKPVFEKSGGLSYKAIYMTDDKYSVGIVTEKNIYKIGDKITLLIKNNSGSSIYFEPCEYLGNFEKKNNGVWRSEKEVIKDKVYDSNNFRKEKNITSCSIDLPKSGAGTYRVAIEVYYNCQMPGENTCSNSKVFYSNEFKVIGGENDFCDDKVLENCDGKRVSVTGTFTTSKAHFLSGIENRIVEHQWAGGIMVSVYDSNIERMRDGKRYNVIGVIRKGGQPCGINNEQCMINEQGTTLSYPTSIKVEKVYLVE